MQIMGFLYKLDKCKLLLLFIIISSGGSLVKAVGY